MQSRIRPPSFSGRLHDVRTATVVGRLLGIAVAICFLTGLVSHLLQEPPGWLTGHLPTRPVSGYRITQGLHVISGIAAVPLLLVKLWTVYPRLFEWPPVRGVGHALERLSIAVLVAATILELFMGLLNTVQWYPWPFSFRSVHYALGWVIIGSLLVHLAVKAPHIAAHWRRPRPVAAPQGAATGADDEQLVRADRRSLLVGLGVAVGTVTVVTAGQSVTPLARLDLLAPRHPDNGEQGLPVNRTASAAGVDREAVRSWRLSVGGPQGYELTLDQLRALPQHRATLPIACVEGWSKSANWEGVRIKDLLERAGLPDGARLRVVSLQTRGGYRVTEMDRTYTRDDLALLALRLNGEVLSPDHGYPARIIAPNRPGVLQTKWVTRLEVIPG
ncbi:MULTISPECIES: molybdopterin-dependent oxidoreductase [Streptomyces]|uniref:molybdopterin-dependent oxidoreductase n=1 Tax=Streptomyces TaxID=1883 RepID=UPI00240DE90F|nr:MULTISPECIES: molybdopterin-dependent oxidoreductase [Streptomyces]WFB83609.1 molybdopterin-dependent oxidoreductase [Streptomyces olivaceus]WGK45912.1 molybdopterin-dependent oxidoreductase [Streptomyces sp. B146]